jgi:hypothetical protein
MIVSRQDACICSTTTPGVQRHGGVLLGALLGAVQPAGAQHRGPRHRLARHSKPRQALEGRRLPHQ